jgi:hypothetical protein
MFDRIRDIDSDFNRKIFLTFDIDWCSDKVLSFLLDILEKYNVRATIFVTHDTYLLDRIRENNNIELGIHPNFNFLLNGDFRLGKNVEEIIEYCLKLVPDAISVRSHSMTQSSTILSNFAQYGLKYDCNHYIPKNSV